MMDLKGKRVENEVVCFKGKIVESIKKVCESFPIIDYVYDPSRFFFPRVFIPSSTTSNSQGRLSHGEAAVTLLVPDPTPAHASGKQIRYRRLTKRPRGAYVNEIRERGNISEEEAASGDDVVAPEFGAATANISLSTPRQQRAASS
ncbi:hypothetical protein Fmac_029857 [Flemingia macrophylla]|uniref:Uncharacterized protein n=1 Tax=Flemingia macrophylla TaxID=520843 RepID=A0ABD1LBU4_9FABA